MKVFCSRIYLLLLSEFDKILLAETAAAAAYSFRYLMRSTVTELL